MRKLWNMRWFRVLFGVVLTAALLAPVVLPALQMQQKEPENPIRKENIQPVRRLSFGDGDGGTLAAAPLSHEDSSGGGKSEQEQQPEQPPEENTDETPEKSPEQPQPTPEPQPGQASSEQPGEETGGQTDDAGDEAQPDALDLGLVLSWYRYGGERYRSICPADTTVRQDVRTAQLPDGYLRYELDLRGLDAVDTQITGVQLSENNGAYEPADVRGSIEMQVGPQGEDSYYTLRVQAVCTHVLEDGTRQEQETEFCFVLVYSDELDLEAQLQWNLASGGAASLRCQPGRQAARTVKSDEISENLLRYSFRLGGESAEDAKILSAEYRSADGQSGTLQTDGGALTLQSDADGKNTYTIALLTEINSFAHAVRPGAVGNVVVDAHGEGIWLLEDHADLAPQLVHVHGWCEDILSIIFDLAFNAHARDQIVHAVERLEKRRFSAAGGANEGCDALFRDVHRHALECLCLPVPKLQIFDCDNIVHTRFPFNTGSKASPYQWPGCRLAVSWMQLPQKSAARSSAASVRPASGRRG